MISKVLTKLVKDKHADVKTISSVTGSCSTTVYNWMRGKGEPTEKAIRSLIVKYPGSTMRSAIVKDISWGMATVGDNGSSDSQSLDFDGDGKIDLKDAVAASIKMNQCVSSTLEIVYNCCERDKDSASESDVSTLMSQLDSLGRCVSAVKTIYTEKSSIRRKAK